MRVLVCGGRNYQDKDAIWGGLDRLHSQEPITCVIHGHAKGTDAIAAKWARVRGIALDAYHAQWREFGLAAGPIRNQQMIDEGKPDMVLAFPGGKGTWDMVKRAEKAGLEVIRPMHGVSL